MRVPLFDVVLSSAGDNEDPHAAIFSARVIDTRSASAHPIVAQSEEFHHLNDAIDWARSAVTGFMLGTARAVMASNGKTLGIVLLLLWASLIAGCAEGRAQCHYPFQQVPGTGDAMECSAVQVDSDVDAPTAVHDRLMSVVRKDDGVAVNFTKDRDMPTSTGNITIVSSNSGLIVISQDHWLPQVDADAMASDAAKTGGDRLNQVVTLIRAIHAWQDKNPRPNAPAPPTAPASVSTVTAAPVTVTVPAQPAAPAPPYHWTPVLRAWAIVITYILIGVVVGRALRVYWRRNCPRCQRLTSRSAGACIDHGFLAWGLGATWALGLLILLAVRAGERLGNRGSSTRQERKLIDAKNKRAALEIEKRNADTAYNTSVAELEKMGIHAAVPGIGEV